MRPKQPHIDAELQELNASLLRETDTDMLRVPEGYFEDLEGVLLDIAKPRTAGKVLMRTRWIGFAAAATVVVVTGLFLLLRDKPEQPLHIALANMSDQELDDWYAEQLSSISYDDLYAYLEQGIGGIEAQDLFETAFADSSSIAEQLYSQIDGQVQAEANTQEKILEDHYIESVGEEAIQEYLNEAFILEDIGL